MCCSVLHCVVVCCSVLQCVDLLLFQWQLMGSSSVLQCLLRVLKCGLLGCHLDTLRFRVPCVSLRCKQESKKKIRKRKKGRPGPLGGNGLVVCVYFRNCTHRTQVRYYYVATYSLLISSPLLGCNTLHHTATHCNTLQTHCNTLQIHRQ